MLPDGASAEAAMARALAGFDDGGFYETLARRVALPTVAADADRGHPAIRAYLDREMHPALEALGCAVREVANPEAPGSPVLIGARDEDPALPTVLCYGHADVVPGMEGAWSDGRDPWRMTRVGERWYGRGTADNKGQHSIVLAALAAVLATRGRLGFNLRWLIDSSEETGSPGLRTICLAEREAIQADFVLASDGPRLDPERPTLVLGTRGALNFALRLKLREGGLHSGNWGGLARNPATILANAIAAIIDANGRCAVAAWAPDSLTEEVRAALADIEPRGEHVDPHWGAEGLTPAERVFGWNTFEVLALGAGDPVAPVNAIPPQAVAQCQIRTVVGTEVAALMPALRRFLDERGFADVAIEAPEEPMFRATRLSPADPLARLVADEMAAISGKPTAVLPNAGGSLPTDVLADDLGMPTLWVPHSYTGCGQHGPDEHLLEPVAREGLAIMTGLFWRLGQGLPPDLLPRRR
ncbi:MAG: M20/M25/M40 family metallo-hydrolase [Azospirillaceae bacterium]